GAVRLGIPSPPARGGPRLGRPADAGADRGGRRLLRPAPGGRAQLRRLGLLRPLADLADAALAAPPRPRRRPIGPQPAPAGAGPPGGVDLLGAVPALEPLAAPVALPARRVPRLVVVLRAVRLVLSGPSPHPFGCASGGPADRPTRG